MVKKHFKFIISILIGLIVVVSLFYTYDQYLDKDNGTPVKVYKYTTPKSIEKTKDVITDNKQVSSKTAENKIESISKQDKPVVQNQSTDISDVIMELQTVLNQEQNDPLNEDNDNQSDTKSDDTDNVNPKLDPTSQALNRYFATDPGTKESLDAFEDLIDEFSVSDNPELRRIASVIPIPRDANGKRITLWELNQLHLGRTQGKRKTSDE